MRSPRSRSPRALCAGLIAGLLSACSGSSSTMPHIAVPASSAPNASTAVQRAPASIAIAIPKQSTLAQTRAPQYVSPATQSIAVTITPSSGPAQTYNANLTAQSGNCVSNLTSTICTLAIPGGLMPGAYTGSFTTYDGVLSGSGIPTGNALSTNQSVPFTIQQAQSNTLNIALGGLARQFSIVPQGAGASAPFVLGSQSVGYRLAGRFTQRFFVVAQDADDNPIIGAGAPTYAISTTGSPPVTIAQPVVTGLQAAPNTFALTPTSATASAYQVTVTATYPTGITGSCTGSGVACSASVAVTNVPLVAEGEILYGSVAIFAGSDPAALATTGAGVEVQGTTSMTFDTGGNLFIADCACEDNVVILRPPYTTREALAGAPGDPFTIPYSVAVDATQHLYVADAGADKVFIFSYATTPATYVSSFPTGSQPYSVTVDGAGTVLTADSVSATITVYNPSFASTPTTLGDARFVQPLALASFGTTTFVADRSASTSGAVFVLKPAAGAPYESVVNEITTGMNAPDSVSVDQNGNLFVVQSGSNVTEYTAASNYTSVTTISTALSQPLVAAVDGAGALYVGDFGFLAIFGPPYTGSPAITSVSLPQPGLVYGLATSD